MNTLIAESQIAKSLGITTKAVRLRAVKDNWKSVKKPTQGGYQHYYMLPMLPAKIRKDLEHTLSPVRQILHRPAPPKSKEIGLAKFQLVKAFRMVKEEAPFGGKAKAVKDFLLAYNSGVVMPEVFKKVGKIAERTLDALDKKLRDSNDDYAVLCDGRGGWRKYGTTLYRERRLSPQAQALLLRCWLHQSRPTIMMAIRAAWMALEKIGAPEKPSEATMRRWLKDYEKYNAHVICVAREGMKAYVDKFGPYGTRDASLLKVGQCLVADGKTLNFNILHPDTGRPCRMKLIVFLDWASRYPAGWQIMPTENMTAILAAFRHAAVTLGRYPESIYIDNGKAFKAKVFTETNPDFEELVGIYARVGTAVTFAKPYNGRAKVVERFFNTIQSQLEDKIPSFCGDSISTKPAHMHRNEKFHKELHEAQTKGWIPTIRDAAHIISAYIDWYSAQPHSGLDDKTPAQIFFPCRGQGIDPIQLNHDFLWRKEVLPRNCRVTMWGIDYESDCLHGLSRKIKITAMYDTSDLRRIWCYSKEGEYLGEVYPVEALHPLALLFGDQVSLDQVQKHNRRMARLKKETRQNLEALGISRKAQNALEILPFKTEKVRIDQVTDQPLQETENQIKNKTEIEPVKHLRPPDPQKELTDAEAEKIEAEVEEYYRQQEEENKKQYEHFFDGLSKLTGLDRYEKLIEASVRNIPIPDEWQEFMKYFEQTSTYKAQEQYFESFRAKIAMMYPSDEDGEGPE